MRERLRHLKRKASPIVAPVVTLGLNLCFPPRCVACAKLTETADSFCAECFAAIRFIDDPCCVLCGFPFEFDLGEQSLCGYCMHDPPPYDTARAVFHYDDATRRMIARFKYQDCTQRAPVFGRLLARAGRELTAKSQVIIPVPLHLRRMFQRKYNQSALLAFAVADHCCLPVLPDGLLRVRHTQPQAGLTRPQRLDNVRGAFRVNHRQAAYLKGKSVLLIDDVITTGATIHHCTKLLKSAGVAKVHVLTLAKTVRD